MIEILIFIFMKKNYKLIKKNIRKKGKYSRLYQKKELFDIKIKFAIISDSSCEKCGILSFYIHYVGCLSRFLNSGYIPIIDLKSFPNIFNGFNISSINKNPWEDYFEQPFGYTLNNVKKYSKNISYFKCTKLFNYPIYYIYKNTALLDYYHYISMRYLPLKKELIKESNFMKEKLFKNSQNILGILARGTDYIAAKPKNHPIPPKIKMMIKDINEMDKKYYYDWFFLSTEDDKVNIKNK